MNQDSISPNLLHLCTTRVGSKSSLEKFQTGQIRFSSLERYRARENKGKHWFDGKEDIQSVYQPHEIKSITIESKDKKIVLTSQHLKSQIFINANRKNVKALCFHAVYFDTETHPTGEDLLQAVRIPSSMKKYGDHVLLIEDYGEFTNRINTILLKEDVHGRSRLVRYEDFKTYNGDFEPEDIGFVKDISFAEEREYRILLHTPSDTSEELVIDIGSIADITKIMPLDHFNSTLEIYRE